MPGKRKRVPPASPDALQVGPPLQVQELYRLLVEGTREYAIVMLDARGVIITWNRGAERINGYRAEDIIGKHFSCFHLPDEIARGKPESELQIALERGQYEEEGWRLRKDGSRFWANVVITPLFDQNELRGYSKVTRDLTYRREGDDRIRSIVNNVLDGIITIDEHGIIQSFNPAAERIFGYNADEVKDQNVKLLMPEPYHSEHDGYIANYLQTGEAKIIGIGREVIGRRKDGSTFPMDLAVSAFRVGKERFFTGIVRDITDRKRLEQELRQRMVELADADRRKDEFLAMLAHELRNPLAPLRNTLHVLKIPELDPEIAAEAQEMMERQIEHMVRLVDDLLDVSRIMRGKISLRPERIELADVIGQAVETARPIIDAHGHRLEISLPTEPVTFQADRVRLAQVISNLLNNAAKYTENAGMIWLTADVEEDELVLRVRDTGIGIASELLPQVFEPFVQAEQGRDRTHGGLGIGLTLVRSLTELHGGSVQAASEGPGKGSEFVVRLPLHESAKAVGRSGPRRQRSAARRVLVVDDNVDAAKSLAMLLKLGGHEVQLCHDGKSALAAAQETRPEIVFLDIGMPVMDGYEVARRLRRKRELDDSVLVAVTGWGTEEDRRLSREAGFDYHLVKPVQPAVLERLMRENPARR